MKIESTLPCDNKKFMNSYKFFTFGGHLDFFFLYYFPLPHRTVLYCAVLCALYIYIYIHIAIIHRTNSWCVVNTHQIPYDVTESFSICLRFTHFFISFIPILFFYLNDRWYKFWYVFRPRFLLISFFFGWNFHKNM